MTSSPTHPAPSPMPHDRSPFEHAVTVDGQQFSIYTTKGSIPAQRVVGECKANPHPFRLFHADADPDDELVTPIEDVDLTGTEAYERRFVLVPRESARKD